jgi:stearoyl-CoA desaturase (delta-9 desaturase)
MLPFPSLNPSWTGLLAYTLVTTHLTIISVTLYLHRSQAHKTVQFHSKLNHFFRFWLWLTTGMITKEWVAVHRKHHIKVETSEDPHSPWRFGIWNILIKGAFIYNKEANNKATIENFGVGTPNDWLEKNVYTKNPLAGIFILLTIELMLFSYEGFVVWIVQMAWIPFWAAGVINGIGHYKGYRNWGTKDKSKNIFPLGILIGGEELHNNHHAFPRSAKLSYKPLEFDIGWMYIKLLQKLKLATVKENFLNSRSRFRVKKSLIS